MIGLVGIIFFAIPSQGALLPRSFHPQCFFAIQKTVTATKNHKDGIEQNEKDVSSKYVAELRALEELFDNDIMIEEIDVNDTEIARLESDLKSLNTRVDSYMLEGVLIGSLTFSGFLTIIASGSSLNFVDLKNLNFGSMPFNGQSSKLTAILTSIDDWATAPHLFSVIMVESLFCSVFFILVLALHIRFTQLSLKLDYLLRIMTIFNAKEEEMINLEMSGTQVTDYSAARRRMIAHKITEAINDANKFTKDIKPLVSLMALYRNLGLVLFFLILITSGFFFSAKVGISIFLLAIATWVFRVVEKWRSFEKIQRLLQRH